MTSEIRNLGFVVLIGPCGSGKRTFPRPVTVVLTTPNREYNVRWENSGSGDYSIPTSSSDGPGKSSKTERKAEPGGTESLSVSSR